MQLFPKLHTYMHGSEAAICVSGHVLVCSRRVVQRFTSLRNEEVSDLWWVSVCLSKLAAAFSRKPSFILVRRCFQKSWPAIRQPDCIPGCQRVQAHHVYCLLLRRCLAQKVGQVVEPYFGATSLTFAIQVLTLPRGAYMS